MPTLRYNPFNQVHKGLRALLYDTALLIQHTDFTRWEQTEKVSERVHFVNEVFAAHAYHEDNHVFPMIAGYTPDVVADFESQHQVDHELSEGLCTCLGSFAETNPPEQNVWAGNELLQAFNSFLAFNVEHMKKEETMINAVLWQYYSDAELLQMTRKIVASIPIEQNIAHSAWMLKGLGVHEIIAWYKGIRQGAPPVVFERFYALAEKTLAPGRWGSVREAFGGAMVTSAP